jgi:Homeodomain-like domain
VLLPVSGLLQRLDLAEVIGAALVARAQQASLRQIAAAVGVPLGTVWGWLGRFAVGGADRRAFRQAGGLAGSQCGGGRAGAVVAPGCSPAAVATWSRRRQIG